MYEWNDRELLRTLAERVKNEIKPNKVKDRKPGDERKPSKNQVARLAGIDRTAITNIEKGHADDGGKLKSLPDTATLLKLCNAFDCELDYLLGFQAHKKKKIGSVTDITGLSEEVVESLAEEVEFKKANISMFDEDELCIDNFLEYLILNRPKTELLKRIGQEKALIQINLRCRKNTKSYQIAKSAFEEARKMGMHETPMLRLLGHPGSRVQQRIFRTVLAGRLEVNEEDVDNWAISELGEDTNYLFQLFELERTRAERIRVIEDCFTDLVKDYLKEEENNAEK